MFPFFCKSRLLITKTAGEDLGFLQCHTIISLLPRPFSSSSVSEDGVSGSRQDKGHSFTVSYLINSCGLSPQTALSVFKCGRVHFETLERPDSVLTFLRDHGFTDKHFPKLVRIYPQLLLSNPQKAILPKFQFFYSIGFSRPDLVGLFHSCPRIFYRSLNNHIIACYHILKSLVKLDEKVVCAMKRHPMVLGMSLRKCIASNISLLRKRGMPESFYSYIVTSYSSIICQPHVKFQDRVERLKDVGFDPKKVSFIHAMQEVPICMNYLEAKIMAVMDFLVNKIGWPPAAIARIPTVIGMSLKKRIVPRCSVAKVLQMKGLTKRSFISNTIFCFNEEEFLDKFVTKYEQHVPQLLALYQGKIGFVELGLPEL